jgi:8-oxo-dGTP pyrophosphatase MutT (NUDIX family)
MPGLSILKSLFKYSMGKPKSRIDHWLDPYAPMPTSRKPSASAFVCDEAGRILLLRRTDNNLWTIPTGGLKRGETITQCAIRECKEETGIDIAITGLVGVFSTPNHIIEYRKGERVTEVRQPVNVCLRASPVGGELKPDPAESSEVRWVIPAELNSYEIHPALRRRVEYGLSGSEPHID